MSPENEIETVPTPEAEITAEETEVEETTEEVETTNDDAQSAKEKKLRNEAASYRVKLRELEKQVEDFRRSQLSEKERLELERSDALKENSVLKESIRDTLLEAAVAKNVRKYELADADATFRLLDRSKVEFNDDGRPVNIDEVLGDTLERYPFLKVMVAETKKQAVDTGTTNPGKQRSQTLSKDAIARMSPAERAANKDKIDAWMANGYK